MKKDITPKKKKAVEKVSVNYRYVVFLDISSGEKFFTRSTVSTKEEIEWEDGKMYPLYKIDVSSVSHPFYTGKSNFASKAGRVERFKQKYNLK